MPYEKIAQAILQSSEIRISKSSEPGEREFPVKALAFVSSAGSVELSLEEKGDYLETRIEPQLRQISGTDIAAWYTVSTGTIQYIEIIQRWFIEEPAKLLGARFAGLRIVGIVRTLEAEVDDDMVGAFVVRLTGHIGDGLR